MGEEKDRIELRIDVGVIDGAASDDPLEVAATIHPAAGRARAHPVYFAFAGASYTRAYFDVPVPGYSMAAYFTARGFTLVALDHLGSGESSWPAAAPPDLIAAANDRAVAGVLATVREDPRTAIPGDGPVLGIGHSMGGHLVTRQQADHRTFAAIAVLGWSATHTIIRAADGSLLTSLADSEREPADASRPVVPERFRDLPPGYLYTRPRSALARWAFYPDGLDPAVIAADEDGDRRRRPRRLSPPTGSPRPASASTRRGGSTCPSCSPSATATRPPTRVPSPLLSGR